MINENYVGSSGQRHVSQAEIKKMQKNMQKVPEIQAKSDVYHQKESLKAELEFEKAQENIKNTEEIIITKDTEETKKHTWRQNLVQKLRASPFFKGRIKGD